MTFSMQQLNKLSDFIFIEKSIPDDICDYILEELESNHWEKHQWGSITGGLSEKEETSKDLHPASLRTVR